MIAAGVLAALLAPQDAAAPLWQVHGSGPGAVVSARQRDVPVGMALRELAEALRLGIAVDPAAVQELELVSVDLALTRQPPEQVGKLLAAAAGCVARLGGQVLEVARPQGAARLRAEAIACCRQVADAAADSAEERRCAAQARMAIAGLLAEDGDPQGAIAVYTRVFESDAGQGFAAAAALGLARLHLRLAESGTGRAAHLLHAADAARRAQSAGASRAEAAAAVVLLGRALLAASRHAEAIAALAAPAAEFADRPEYAAIQLLLARCHVAERRPDLAAAALDELVARHGIDRLDREQRLDYSFDRGVATTGLAVRAAPSAQRQRDLEQARDRLEDFLGACGEDARRALAFVTLGVVYLELEQFLEAQASAEAALQLEGQLDRSGREAALLLHGRLAVALGAGDDLLEELAVAARAEPAGMPDLSEFLVETLASRHRFARALAVAEEWLGAKGADADRARLGKVRALHAWCSHEQRLAELPALAVPVAAGIRDEALRRQAGRLVAQGFRAAGDEAAAARALRGEM